MDFSFDDIKNTINNIESYQNGFAYLMNENTEFIVHPAYDQQQSITSQGFVEIAKEIQSNKSGMFISTYKGKKMYSSYARLTNGWIMSIAAPQGEVFEKVRQLSKFILLITIVLLIISAIVMYLFGNSIARPITELSGIINRMANYDLSSKKNLNINKYLKRNDEIGRISNSLMIMQRNFLELIQSIKDISTQVAASSEELSATGEQVGETAEQVSGAIQGVASGAEEQPAQVEETNSNIEDMIGQIQRRIPIVRR